MAHGFVRRVGVSLAVVLSACSGDPVQTSPTDAGADTLLDAAVTVDAELDSPTDVPPSDVSADVPPDAAQDVSDDATHQDATSDANPDATIDASADMPDRGACPCPSGEHCADDGLCSPGDAPIGGYCGPTPTCGIGSPDFGTCADAQCATRSCTYFSMAAAFVWTCGSGCTFAQDANLDGISDTAEECAQAVNGPAGNQFQCVLISAPNQTPRAVCLPGSNFAACATNADCPSDEVCQVVALGGQLGLRCMARYRSTPQWAGTVVDYNEPCNEDAASGPVALCGSGYCLPGQFCSKTCVTEADCDTTTASPGVCANSQCANGRGTCSVDADCSDNTCVASEPFGPGFTLNLCAAKP